MTKQVRAKFFVSDKHHHHTADPNEVYATITLKPVMANNDDNASWSKYTPQGNIEMGVTNPDAIDALEIGKEYFIDFTPA